MDYRILQSLRDASRSVAILVAAVAAIGATGCSQKESEDPGQDDPGGARGMLVEPGCPPRYEVSASFPRTEETVARARQGRFSVRGHELRIVPPVDWTLDPEDSEAFVHTLHKMRWLDVLLFAYREGDRGALRRARDLVDDWVAQNPRDGTDPAGAWGEKRVADRAPYLAYTARAAACEGMLGDRAARRIVASLRDHARVLTDPGEYKPTNHGLFMDYGLSLLARQVPSLGAAERWRQRANRRFTRTLRGRTAGEEGYWLEHSPGYQVLITKAVRRFTSVPGNGGEWLDAQRERMEEVTRWLATPDRRIPQLGDSDHKPVPPWAGGEDAARSGLLFLPRSGLAIARRERGAHLAVAAGFHSTSHKHADELGFTLYHNGTRVISDTGLFHKDPDESRSFARSARAHSVLTVDGEDFPLGTDAPYGSGLIAAGEGEGWFAILGRNPLVRGQGVRHRRLFLYRPGEALIVIDRVRAGERHVYRRYFQLGPAVRIERREREVALRAPGLRGALRDEPAADGGAELEAVRGRRDPLAGLTAPSFRRWEPRWTLALRSEGADRDHVAVIDLSGSGLRARLARSVSGSLTVRLGGKGREPALLRVTRSGRELTVTRS